MSGAYYNEFDPFAAAWLRELIKDGLIAGGDVDERSITDVQPGDLRGYTQCHFFAGIGGWSAALRLAGWPDDRPVWTGSCPCPSFSCAGKGAGFSDPRHLWPDWFRLIRESAPSVIFGEQVEAAIGHGWLDLVQTDLENEKYAFGSAVLTAAGVGAFHIRQRVYWVADANVGGRSTRNSEAGSRTAAILARQSGAGSGAVSLMADTEGERGGEGLAFRGGCAEGSRAGQGAESVGGISAGELADTEHAGHDRPQGLAPVTDSNQSGLWLSERDSTTSELANAEGTEQPGSRRARDRREGLADSRATGELGNPEHTGLQGHGRLIPEHDTEGREGSQRHSSKTGFWSDAIWLPCRDGKLRPAQPEIFPLAHGIPNRVGILRGAGNAISPQVAAEFIQAYAEAEGLTR